MASGRLAGGAVTTGSTPKAGDVMFVRYDGTETAMDRDAELDCAPMTKQIVEHVAGSNDSTRT